MTERIKSVLLANLKFAGRHAKVVRLDGCMADVHVVIAEGRIHDIKAITPAGARGESYLYASVGDQSRPLHEFIFSHEYGSLVAYC